MAKYELTRTDRSKWIVNLVVFIAPVAILYLTQVQAGVVDGVTAGDFIPSQFTFGAMTLYVINTLIDLLKKFMTNTTS